MLQSDHFLIFIVYIFQTFINHFLLETFPTSHTAFKSFLLYLIWDHFNYMVPAFCTKYTMESFLQVKFFGLVSLCLPCTQRISWRFSLPPTTCFSNVSNLWVQISISIDNNSCRIKSFFENRAIQNHLRYSLFRAQNQ